jgi:hypothetical protein
LFLGAFLDMDYGYFQALRYFGFFGFAYLSYAEKGERKLWMILWGGSTILINPWFKFIFSRESWNFIDAVWIILLLVSVLKMK